MEWLRLVLRLLRYFLRDISIKKTSYTVKIFLCRLVQIHGESAGDLSIIFLSLMEYEGFHIFSTFIGSPPATTCFCHGSVLQTTETME